LLNDDGLEHSIWLGLMRAFLLRNLLAADGSCWIQLDDNEAQYCKVLAMRSLAATTSSPMWSGISPTQYEATHSSSHPHMSTFWFTQRIARSFG
jgi:hypothetical protein